MLTRELLSDVPPNGPTDPIAFYRRPLVGWLFRERINRGLRLLPAGRVGAALEIGYAAGAVLCALAPRVDELHGIDKDADPAVASALLKTRGHEAALRQGDVRLLPYPAARFDLVVCFSVIEHLREPEQALAEMARVLRPEGRLLLGMPQVNRAMSAAFAAIGFRGIDDHHVTTPAEVEARFAGAGLSVVDQAHLDVPLPAPFGLRIYYDWLLERRHG